LNSSSESISKILFNNGGCSIDFNAVGNDNSFSASIE